MSGIRTYAQNAASYTADAFRSGFAYSANKLGAVHTYARENIYNKMSDRHKVITLVVLAALAAYALVKTYCKFSKCAKPINPLAIPHGAHYPDIDAKLTGRIFYGTTVLHLDGNFRIDDRGLINGKGKITKGTDSYDGEFHSGKFIEGTCTRVINGRKYEIDVKDFVYTSVEEEFLTDMPRGEAGKEERRVPIDKAKFQQDNDSVLYDGNVSGNGRLMFSYEGALKGRVFYGNKLLEVTSEEIRFDHRGRLNGKGKVVIGGYTQDGEFRHGDLLVGKAVKDSTSEIYLKDGVPYTVGRLLENADGRVSNLPDYLTCARAISDFRSAVSLGRRGVL